MAVAPPEIASRRLDGRLAHQERMSSQQAKSRVANSDRKRSGGRHDFGYARSGVGSGSAALPNGALNRFKWLLRTDPEEAGILTLFFFPVWCLLVVLGLLIGRRAGWLVTGGKRVAQR
jgi:hypothetical protein